MKKYEESFPAIGREFVVCIGKFDGMHIGHQQIFDALRQAGKNCEKVAYVLDVPSRSAKLCTPQERTDLLICASVDSCVCAKVSGPFAHMEPEAFLERLCSCGKLKAVVVGENFRFGHQARGDVDTLRVFCGNEIQCIVVPMAQDREHGIVSSTLIRNLLLEGNVRAASELLGRPYSLEGCVVRGQALGRTIGFPTANTEAPEGKLLPADGVYAAVAETAKGRFPAMCNIGVRPTVQGSKRNIETHIIGEPGDLYGQTIRLELMERLRPEIKFDSVDNLAAQLRQDRLRVIELAGNWGE